MMDVYGILAEYDVSLTQHETEMHLIEVHLKNVTQQKSLQFPLRYWNVINTL